MIKQTHTYAVLEVQPVVYMAVRALLARAGYEHTFIDDGADGEVIDMHGIGLKSTAPLNKAETSIIVGSILAGRTREGRVEMSLNAEVTQMSLDEARKVHRDIGQAIEAAISDQLLWQFLTTQVDMPDGQAAAALLDFREMRQGSRGVVTPT